MAMYNAIFVLLLTCYFIECCKHRDYGNGGTVCVCNDAYCDQYDPVTPTEKRRFLTYTSDKNGLRFNLTDGQFISDFIEGENVVTINADLKYQKIFGFGGAFTDSAGININSLSGKSKEFLLKSYFSKSGIEYSLCRVPIGGTDFSTRPYTYDDIKDENLSQFNLTFEDFTYKIPLINKAYSLTDGNLRLFASAWSAPAWMKTNNALSGIGYLYKKYYQTWADYFIKFLEHYEKTNIHFWGITTGNEPLNGVLPFIKINSLGWTPNLQSTWIRENLGPTIRNSKYKDLKIMALDDQRFFLPWWPNMLLKNNLTKNYIDGIAVHWYWDQIFPANLLTETHSNFPDKFILATEACVGDKFYQKKVILGSWHRGEMYASDIIDDLNNWSTGWVDWNMALNEQGGPTYINNFVDSPIIVNSSAQEFYKQPMYYTLGHFSKFIPRDSIRISAKSSTSNLKVTAIKRPDNGTTVVVLNTHARDMDVVIRDKARGFFTIKVNQHSINTIIYW